MEKNEGRNSITLISRIVLSGRKTTLHWSFHPKQDDRKQEALQNFVPFLEQSWLIYKRGETAIN